MYGTVVTVYSNVMSNKSPVTSFNAIRTMDIVPNYNHDKDSF